MRKVKSRKQKEKEKFLGFTLIEILVVIGILGIVMSLATGMFFWILKGTAKSQAIQEVKQNGAQALSVMERMIRNARRLDVSTADSDHIEITNPDGGTTVFSCEEIGDKNLIASNSASLLSGEVEVTGGCGIFTVVPGIEGASPVRVDISFTLGRSGSALRLEDEASADFQTTVVLRNF